MNDTIFDENLVLQCTNEVDLKDKLLFEQFTHYIRNLILNDFEKLIFILYRIDVHETKLRELLNQHPQEDAAEIIAETIINRQIQKIQLRATMQPGAECDEEKW